MTYTEVIERAPFVLCDGGIETRIAFETELPLDPDVGVARLVDDDRGRAALEGIYRSYLAVGRRHGLPMQVGTPTFRASPAWLARAGLTGPGELARFSRECTRLLTVLREEDGGAGPAVFIAGVVGPKGDAYRPEEAPSESEALAYHRAQAAALADSGVDLLYAPTFPAGPEAIGVAAALAEVGLPYALSPIIDAFGTLPDGTPLADLIERIDQGVTPPPACYTVSCVHPSVLAQSLRFDERLARLAGSRLLGIKANASSKPPEELVALDHLDAEAPGRLADEITALQRAYGLRVLGGCCGTDDRHIEALARRLAYSAKP